MLIQDALTGRLHEVPDPLYASYLGEYNPQARAYPHSFGYSPQYGEVQVVYDGLGNPVGIIPLLAKLAPLAVKAAGAILPALTKALPAVTQALPQFTQALPAITSFFPSAPPSGLGAPVVSSRVPQFGEARVVYDGLGNPVGILPLLTALAPLAAKAVGTVLPAITKVLPSISSLFPGAAAPAPQPVPPPVAPVMTPPEAPVMATPMPAPA